MAENILDILTKVDRPHFTIDGKSYEMVHPNELSMTEFHVLLKLGNSFESWGKQYKSDPEAAVEAIQMCMDELLDMIAPDLPETVKKKLNPFHVQALLGAFTGLSRIEPKPGGPRNRKKSSRGSRASTAASRKTG